MSAAYKLEAVEHDVFSSVKEQAAAMEKHLRSDEAMQASHSDLESYVAREGREYERRLMQAHLELRAAKERPTEVRGADGVRRSHLRSSHRPLLNLPEELYSHGVRRKVAETVARSSYDEVVADLAANTGAPVPKRQVEELAIRAAADFDAFYAKRTAEPGEGNDLLVMSFDGKGVAMRRQDLREATQKAAATTNHKLQTRLSKGEKRNRKRMAEVAVIYSVAPHPRTVMDIVHDLRPVRDVAKQRPKPVNKQVSASAVLTTKQVIEEKFQEAQRRDPEHQRRWVVLVEASPGRVGHSMSMTRRGAALPLPAGRSPFPPGSQHAQLETIGNVDITGHPIPSLPPPALRTMAECASAPSSSPLPCCCPRPSDRLARAAPRRPPLPLRARARPASRCSPPPPARSTRPSITRAP